MIWLEMRKPTTHISTIGIGGRAGWTITRVGYEIVHLPSPRAGILSSPLEMKIETLLGLAISYELIENSRARKPLNVPFQVSVTLCNHETRL